MSADQRLEALVLRSSPLGESDRLLTVLSAAEGLTRLAAPGARKPKSSLAAAVPLALLSLQVGGRSGLRRVRQLRVVRNYSALAERLETLAAAQGLAELSLELVPTGAAVEGVLDDLLLQLNRLELVVKERQGSLEALAIAVQGAVHLLALGGYALPLATIGWMFAAFHVLLMAGVIPENIRPCTQGVPCSEKVIEWFGFVTIPLLAVVAFSIIIALLVMAHRRGPQ